MIVELLPRSDQESNQRLLVTISNRATSPLVLGIGNERDDWLKSYTVSQREADVGRGRTVLDGVQPGGSVCPSPQSVVVIPSGGSLARLQEIDVAGVRGPVERVLVRVRILVYPSSLECGKADFIETSISAGHDPRR